MVFVMDFEQIDRTKISDVGGKGAQLGELSRIDGIRVPPGFCVTTDAFQRIVAERPAFADQLDSTSSWRRESC
jgi:phosphoenolpyruvate synthase/pyruvate phosphate dikinase